MTYCHDMVHMYVYVYVHVYVPCTWCCRRSPRVSRPAEPASALNDGEWHT